VPVGVLHRELGFPDAAEAVQGGDRDRPAAGEPAAEPVEEGLAAGEVPVARWDVEYRGRPARVRRHRHRPRGAASGATGEAGGHPGDPGQADRLQQAAAGGGLVQAVQIPVGDRAQHRR
jgi:hypothetical protein